MILVGAAVMTPISLAVSSQEHSSLLFLPLFFFFFLSASDSDLIDVPGPDGQLHSIKSDFPPDSLEPDPDSPLPFFFFLLSSDCSKVSTAKNMRSVERDLVDLAETSSIQLTHKMEARRAIFMVVTV